MKRPQIMKPAAVVLAALLLAGCFTSTGDKAKKVIIDGGIANYCKASDTGRQVLRGEFTTSKGPLVTVHCENLE